MLGLVDLLFISSVRCMLNPYQYSVYLSRYNRSLFVLIQD